MKNQLNFRRFGRIVILAVVVSACLFPISNTAMADEPYTGFSAFPVYTNQIYTPSLEPEIEPETVDVVQTVEPPSPDEVAQCVQKFDDRNPVVREAAIRRLLPYPQLAAEVVAQVFLNGTLSARLAALELLKEWKAPVDQLDPWQPETLTPERLAALDAWQKERASSDATAPHLRELSAEQLAEAANEIARMLNASDAEAEAIRERLARWGEAVLPQVYEQLKTTVSDHERQRLQALRYRLVAGDSLAERWPDGLLRLASPDTTTRQKIAEELANRASAEDQLLLRELFSDPDPLVREISLRGMQKIGGKTQTMLLDLLADPDPNVRAAVLKQLEEKPGAGVSLKITEYVKAEKDADLVGHAVRVLKTLRQQNDSRATRCLIDLLKHDRWQIRADAAAALAGGGNRYYMSSGSQQLSEEEQLQADVYVALLELLNDEDNFVVSKAIEGLKNINMAIAVEPLIGAIERHPDLAAQVVEILVRGDKMQAKTMPRLQAFAKHDDPRVRAAVIGHVFNTQEGVVVAGILDADSSVRIAAVKALLRQLELSRNSVARNVPVGFPSTSRSSSPSLFSTITRLFTNSTSSDSGTLTPTSAEWHDNVVVEEIDSGSYSIYATPDEQPIPDMGDHVADFDVDATSPEVAVTDSQADDLDFLQNYIASATSTANVENYDKWLLDFYQGKGRPVWMSELVEPLEKMLTAESPEERIVAAVALVPLGKSDEMVPILLETVKNNPELFDSFVQVVPWLVWEKQLALFQQWRELSKSEDSQISSFLYRFPQISGLRYEAFLWSLLEEKDVSFSTVNAVFGKIKPLYLVDKFAYSYEQAPPKKVRTALLDNLSAKAESGSENQRLVAAAILVALDINKAYEVAERLEADTSFSDEFRQDMFQIKLLSQTDKKLREQLAVETLKQKDPLRCKLVLHLLMNTDSHMFRYLRNSIYLTLPSGINFSHDPRKPQPLPTELDLELIMPFLNDENAETSAYASFVAVLLGEHSGMDILLKYWRTTDGELSENSSVATLVYRAIAATNDEQYVPILREIYGKMDSYQVSEFYWTIRGMTGPEILKFRKEIRDKHGMENLR